jgi:hypothetical protein
MNPDSSGHMKPVNFILYPLRLEACDLRQILNGMRLDDRQSCNSDI